MRPEALRELFFFGLIGGVGAVLYMALNLGFTGLGASPSISIAISLIVLMPPVYYLQHRLTFRSTRSHLSAFSRYAGAQLVGNVLAMILGEVFTGTIHAYPLVSWFVITFGVAAVNWGALKFWAFRAAPPASLVSPRP